MFTFENLNSELSALNYPYIVRHKTYGNGRLVDIKAPSTGDSLCATIDFEFGSKMFAVKALLDMKLLRMSTELEAAVTQAQSVFFANYEAVEAEKREAARLAYEKAKLEAEEKKQEEKYQAAKAKTIKEFEALANTEKSMSTTGEFYYSLGWLAKNCGTFACALPDYLLPYFQRQVGTDYEPHTVDSRKRTVNGYAMQ